MGAEFLHPIMHPTPKMHPIIRVRVGTQKKSHIPRITYIFFDCRWPLVEAGHLQSHNRKRNI